MALPAAGYEYESDALADGLIAYYPMFDKYLVNIVADIISGYNLNVINDPDDTTLEDGIIGLNRNLVANGTGALHAMLHRAADAANLNVYDSWTVGIWFNPASLVTANLPTIFDFTSDRGPKATFSYPGSVDTLTVAFSDSGTTFTTTAMPALATKHLLLITCDLATTTVTAYLDNVQIGTDPAMTHELAPWSGQMFVGDVSTLDSSTAYLDGAVDELFFYTRAVDVTERGYIWNTGAGMSLVQYANSERAIVSDVIGLSDSAYWSLSAVASDTLGLGDTVVALKRAIAEAFDTLGLNDVAIVTLRANPTADDTLGLSDVVSGNVRANVSVEDTISFIGGISIDGEAYVGIIMNTETAAVTEYTSFNFNSLARAGTNRYLAADGGGIYELGGDTDDSAEIDAYLTSKLFDFGSDKFKRMDRAYVALRNDGSMVLKTITRHTDGSKHENWYEMEQTSEAVRTQRIKVGKGLKSHYWQFTLTNKAGADFELDTLEFKPIILSRRV